MSVKYEVLKKPVVAEGNKKRCLSATTEELQENRRKKNAKNHMNASVRFGLYFLLPGMVLWFGILLIRGRRVAA